MSLSDSVGLAQTPTGTRPHGAPCSRIYSLTRTMNTSHSMNTSLSDYFFAPHPLTCIYNPLYTNPSKTRTTCSSILLAAPPSSGPVALPSARTSVLGKHNTAASHCPSSPPAGPPREVDSAANTSDAPKEDYPAASSIQDARAPSRVSAYRLHTFHRHTHVYRSPFPTPV